MVLKEKVCDMCKYKVCNEEEYLSATQKERAKFGRLWNKHLRSWEHRFHLQQKQRHDYTIEVMRDEYRNRLNGLRSSIITRVNTQSPEGEKIKAVIFIFENGSVF
jgi:hypothetical protein